VNQRFKLLLVKLICSFLGLVSLALGVIGIFVPLLPTTPFLLLSAVLFARSSEKLYAWLMNHKTFGKYISDYRNERAIPLRVKISALTLMWGTMLYAIFAIAQSKLWLQLLLAAIAIGVTIHILSLKTKK
jgi:uncharacterized membrane protein YbaN (DUF454 family)